MMTSAQVVETSVNVTTNSPSQDYTHPDDRTPLNYDMTPGLKPFTILNTLLVRTLQSVYNQHDPQLNRQSLIYKMVYQVIFFLH